MEIWKKSLVIPLTSYTITWSNPRVIPITQDRAPPLSLLLHHYSLVTAHTTHSVHTGNVSLINTNLRIPIKLI